jgi:RNA polymerase sigma-70 factor (ECF subfamily)
MHTGHGAVYLSDLVEQHYALLYRYAFRLSGSAADAEDLTQQAFLSAHTKLDQLRDPDRAKSWLCSILRNAYLKTVRQGDSFFTNSLDDLPEPAAATPCELPLDQEQLQLALNELPEEYRSAVVLFYFEEFSYKEIAEQLEVPIGTVMSRLARAKAYLRRRLAACATVSP